MHTCEGIRIFIPTDDLNEPATLVEFDCDGYTDDDDRITVYRAGQVIASYPQAHVMGYAVH